MWCWTVPLRHMVAPWGQACVNNLSRRNPPIGRTGDHWTGNVTSCQQPLKGLGKGDWVDSFGLPLKMLQTVDLVGSFLVSKRVLGPSNCYGALCTMVLAVCPFGLCAFLICDTSVPIILDFVLIWIVSLTSVISVMTLPVGRSTLEAWSWPACPSAGAQM